MKADRKYWASAAHHGEAVFRSKVIHDMDEQAGPAYFRGCWLSRKLFWYRLKTALRYVPDSGGNCCIDFGCGFGLTLPLLSTNFSRVVGIDVVPELARAFISRWEEQESKSTRCNTISIVEQFSDSGLKQGSVDAILALDVLEHLEDHAEVLSNMQSWLSPSGSLIVSGPTETAAYRLGRRIVGFSGEYHTCDIYRVETEIKKYFSVKRVGRVPRFPALFEILVATRK